MSWSHTRSHFLPVTWLPNSRFRISTLTAYYLRHLLWHITVVLFCILGIATAVNVAGEIGKIWDNASQNGIFDGLLGTFRYLSLRIADNCSQIFPVALCLGVVWGEIAFYQDGKQTLVRSAGINYFRRSAGLFIIAACAIPVQLSLDNIIRPYAFMSLSKENLGEYGKAYEKKNRQETFWYSFGSQIIKMDIQGSIEPQMSNVHILRFSQGGVLLATYEADRIVPDGQRKDAWRLINVQETQLARVSSQDPFGPPENQLEAKTYADSDLWFPISRLWLEYRTIKEKYIPILDLISLSASTNLPSPQPRYEEWLQVRLAAGFNAGLFILCVSGIFAVLQDRYGPTVSAGAMIAFSYISFTIAKTMAIVVEFQVLPTIIAVWGFTALLAVFALLNFFIIFRRTLSYSVPAQR